MHLCHGDQLTLLTFSWLRSLSYRNQSTDLQFKSMDWFLYGRDLGHERVKTPATLLKGDSNIGVCLGNLRNTFFTKHLRGRCFWCCFISWGKISQVFVLRHFITSVLLKALCTDGIWKSVCFLNWWTNSL